MIIKSLCDYYDRKAADAGAIAPPGFEYKEIPFVIVVDENGRFVPPIQDMREGEGRARRAKVQLVPQGPKRSSGIKPYLLWDNVEYTIGVPIRGKPARVSEQHEAFLARLRTIGGEAAADRGLKSVLLFSEAPDLRSLQRDPAWVELTKDNPFVAFRLAGDDVLVSQRPAITRTLKDSPPESADGRCSITGRPAKIAETHPAIKGVRGAQTSGGNIVSFNLRAFESYGMAQGANASIGEPAAFFYTTALNQLLSRDSRQKIQVGDATVAFWSEKASGRPAEEAFADWFDPPRDDPGGDTARVRALYEFHQGQPLTSDDDQRFFVLGLAPNAARISVRFWSVATIRELGENVFRHFEDLAIVGPPSAPKHPSIYWLLRSIAAQEKAENIPPNLAGDWMSAILSGSPYPLTLLQAAVRRSRAQANVSPTRAALLKATINRGSTTYEEKLPVSLDIANSNAGYRLGRLFATFEKIQEEASPGLNATIRDRYFGSASASPVVAFPILNRLKNHHLAKLENRGRAVNLERLIGEIIDGLDATRPFPPTLSIADQGRFAVGYYQQRQDFFRKREE